MSKIETNKIDSISGTSTLKIGETNATTLDFDTGITSVTNIPAALKNTPMFVAYRTSSAQTISNNTVTKCQYNTELFDTDSCYDNSTNYRFTPTVAGKYFVYHNVGYGRSVSNVFFAGEVFIYKNGSNIASQATSLGGASNFEMASISSICEMNGTTDYLEAFVKIYTTSGTVSVNTDLNVNQFGAYKLIGA